MTARDLRRSIARYQANFISLAVALVVIACITYLCGVGNPFVADDYHHLPSQSFQEVWYQVQVDLRYRVALLPLDWLLYQVFGAEPLAMHLLVLCLHMINTLLVFRLVQRLSGDIWIGFIAGLLFVIYPRNHQSVLWWAAHHIVIGGVFAFLSVLLFIEYLRSGRRTFFVGSVLMLFVSNSFSETGIFLVFFMPLLEIHIRYKDRVMSFLKLRHGLWKYLFFGIVPLLYVFLSVQTIGLSGFSKIVNTVGVVSNCDYHLNPLGLGMIKDALGYLTYLMLPWLALRSLDFNLISLLISMLILCVCGLLMFFGRAAMRLWFAWIGLVLLPFILFVQSGNADRYFYFAVAGFAAIGSLIFESAMKHRGARAGVVLVLAGYTLASFLTIQNYSSQWKAAGENFERVVQFTRSVVTAPEKVSLIILVNLPDYYEEVYQFMGNGIIRAIQRQMKQPQLTIVKINDAAVIQFFSQYADSPPSGAIEGKYVFFYSDGEIIDKSAYYKSFRAAFPDLVEAGFAP